MGTLLGVHARRRRAARHGGVFAGVTQAPITAFVIINEMTDARGMVVPLMIAAFIGYGISRLVLRRSLYHTPAQGFVPDLRPEEPRKP